MGMVTDRRAFVRGAALGAAGLAAACCGAAAAGAEEPGAGGAVDGATAVDGTFTATHRGYGGDVTVTVAVEGGEVSAVSAEGPYETPSRGGVALERVPAAIAAAGTTEGVDTWTGATVTSDAILRGAEDCLVEAGVLEQPGEVRMQPGVWCGSGKGFNVAAPVQVKVEVDETSIKSIELIETDLMYEDYRITAAAEQRLIPRMLESQSVTVDAVTGATGVCDGIKAATADALRKALAAGGSSPTALRNFYVDSAYTDETVTLDYDVVVCGLGGAGSPAACSVAESMAAAGLPVSVLALETAGKWGGTSAVAGEPFSVNPKRYEEQFNGGADYCDPESLYQDWLERFGGGTPCKPEVVRKLIDESGNTIDWLQYEHGYLFCPPETGFADSTWLCCMPYLDNTKGETIDLLSPLYPDYTFENHSDAVGQYYDRINADFAALGGQTLMETQAYELIYDAQSNRVAGVRARSNVDHTEYVINCKAVILATGGFGGNQAMQVEHMASEYAPFNNNPWKIWGMYQNKGQMIESAIQNGAATYNIDMPPCCHLKSTDGVLDRFPVYFRDGVGGRTPKRNRWTLNDLPIILGTDTRSLQVGPDGLRHYNEAGTFPFWTVGPCWYTIIGSDYIDQVAQSGIPGKEGGYAATNMNPFGIGGYPYNRPVPEVYEVLDAARELGYVFKAGTVEELAEAAGLPAEALAGQLERYRQYCETGVDEEFGRAADTLVDKTQGSTLYAVRVASMPYNTLGGLDVDDSINVLLPDGTRMGGLYACGNDSHGVLASDATSYANYGGVALGWAMTSGRLAGQSAVDYLQAL